MEGGTVSKNFIEIGVVFKMLPDNQFQRTFQYMIPLGMKQNILTEVSCMLNVHKIDGKDIFLRHGIDKGFVENRSADQKVNHKAFIKNRHSVHHAWSQDADISGLHMNRFIGHNIVACAL